MKFIIDGLESGPLLAWLDKPKVNINTMKVLIREALVELSDSRLEGEDYNLVRGAFVSRDLL